jgi:hypothetical protein
MVTFGVCLGVAQVIFASVADKSIGRIGMETYMVGAVLMLFLPAFAAGLVAKRSGALYGVVLAGIPIVLFSMVNQGVPTAFYLMWLAVAAVGGYCGQRVAARRRTP